MNRIRRHFFVVTRAGIGLAIAASALLFTFRFSSANSDPVLSRALQQAKTERITALIPKAEEQGLLRVIVQLNVPEKRQGILGGAIGTYMAQADIAEAQEALSRQLLSPQSAVLRNFKNLPLSVLNLATEDLEALSNNPLVAIIQEDVPDPLVLSGSIPLIGADDAWSSGYTGAGQAVAILDTGVDGSHEFLTGKVVAEACFSSNDAGSAYSSLCPSSNEIEIGAGAAVNCNIAIPGCDHGTHVAGIAAGTGGSFSGVAKGADILAVQVFTKFNNDSYCGVGNSPCVLSWTSDQIAGLDWVYNQSGTYSIAAANMSLGGGTYSSNCDSDIRKTYVDQLRSAGIATVISSGNSAYTSAMGAPACISTAISVGSTTSADAISWFSNIASFVSLLAPGSSINSSIPGDSYGSKSGTSMAAPHVTGAWAVLKSKDPGASVDAVLSAFTTTGVSIDDARSGGSVTGMARIQVDSAVSVLPSPTPTPTATTGSPTNTPTSAATSTPTNTPVPPTDTPTNVPTNTPLPPTSTPTNTPLPPTSTPTSTPIPAGSSQWYLADGFTGSGFATFILIQNLGNLPASVDVDYLLDSGSIVSKSHTVPANSRYTITVHDPGELGVDQTFSTSLSSDVPVFVERAMYYAGGGHGTIGLTAPATQWHFAEGYSGDGFTTFIAIQNSNGTDATVDVTYLIQGGSPINKQHVVPANSRYTIAAHDPAEVGVDQAFSTTLSSDIPINAERTMYFGNGGHSTIGVTAPSTDWYLAEGFTGDGTGTFILIQNPNGSTATVDVTYQIQGGSPINKQHVVLANSRYTIVTQDPGEVGVDNAFSTAISSDIPVIVERAMYFGSGGHNTIGLTGLATDWYLAEGFTGSGFSTYILLQNPNGSAATVDVSYQVQGGSPINRQHVVAANSRYTIVTADAGEVGVDKAFSTSLNSDLPIIVERAMYFADGGHNTIAFVEFP